MEKKVNVNHLIPVKDENGNVSIKIEEEVKTIEIEENLGKYSSKYTILNTPIQEKDFGYVIEDGVKETPVQIQQKYDDNVLIVSSLDDNRIMFISKKAFNKIDTDWKYETPNIVKTMLTEGTDEYRAFKTSLEAVKRLEEINAQTNGELPDIIIIIRPTKDE